MNVSSRKYSQMLTVTAFFFLSSLTQSSIAMYSFTLYDETHK